MRKLVLLLLCIALFSYCPKEKNYPLIDLITTNQVLDDVKALFLTDQHDDAHHDGDSREEHTLVGFFDRASEVFSDNISEPLRQALQGEMDVVELKEQQALDLSLPELNDQDFDEDFNSNLDGQQENALPDLFSIRQKDSTSKDSRASIGGRLLIDEQNPNYTMDAVLGAEVSLELKTH